MKRPKGASGWDVPLLLVASLCSASPVAAQVYGVRTLAGTATIGGTGYADGVGSAARFAFPRGVAVDGHGVVYVADTLNDTVRKVLRDGTVTTLAGLAGHPGSMDGEGSAARFNRPSGVAVDAAGVVYVGDSGNNTIRKIQPNGTVTTLAGQAGESGSTDGIGAVARFNYPSELAVDAAGVAYVADVDNHTIRKILPDGTVTTLAGLAGVSGSTDGAGSAARFNQPAGVAVDAGGGLYVADTLNFTIRKVQPDGTVTTLAGLAGELGSADGVGSAARFGFRRV